MAYFKNIKSFEDLKNQFKVLAKINHPDVGGDIEIMKAINSEYDSLFPIWKHRYNVAATVVTTETAESTRSQFYTANGWKGKNYKSGLFTTDISKIIRQYVKEIYPTYKFSVTTSIYSGGSSIYCCLMEAPHEAFKDTTISYLNLNEKYLIENNKITELTMSVMLDINELIKSYHYDDSDSQIDYFRTNFYYHLYIGVWDKPFRVIEKTARIKNKPLKNKPTSSVQLTA